MTLAPDETLALIEFPTSTDNFPAELPSTVNASVLKFSKLAFPAEDISTFNVFDFPDKVTSPELEAFITIFSAIKSAVIFPEELKSIFADVAEIFPAVSFPDDDKLALKFTASI